MIKIPHQALPYLIYQRSSYLSERAAYRFLSFVGTKIAPLFKTTVALKSRLYSRELVAAFNEDILADYDNIKSYLPPQATAVLDIGSGLAGIDIHLSRHYNHAVEVHLLDKTAVEDRIYYSFTDRGAYYNSQALTKSILEYNEVPAEHIYTHEAEEPFDCFGPARYDVITSFISWGFHYPIDTYLAQVRQSLKPDGVVIIDLRKDTDGIAALKTAFAHVEVIFEASKKQRVLARSPIA